MKQWTRVKKTNRDGSIVCETTIVGDYTIPNAYRCWRIETRLQSPPQTEFIQGPVFIGLEAALQRVIEGLKASNPDMEVHAVEVGKDKLDGYIIYDPGALSRV